MLQNRILLNILCFLWLCTVQQIHAQTESETPFLYRYSEEKEAFLIERADGSDGHVLTEFTIPSSCYDAENCNVVGPGWSPSGKWFAWTVDNAVRQPLEEAYAMVVNRNGDQKQTLISGQGSIQTLQWSPIEDLLLISRDAPEKNNTFEHYLWDADTQETTFIMRIEAGFSLAEWTPSGNYFVVYAVATPNDQMHVISPEGQIIAERNLAPLKTIFPLCLPEWSRNDTTIYLEAGSGLVIENFADGEKLEFDFPYKYLSHIRWSLDGNYAFIYASNDCQPAYTEPINSLWLLSVSDQSLKYLSEANQTTAAPDFNPEHIISVDMLYETPDGLVNIEKIYGHPSEDWLFLLGQRVGNGYRLYIINREDTVIRDLGVWYSLNPSSFGWLPDLKDAFLQ